MPLGSDGQVYLCRGCKNRGSSGESSPVRPDYLRLAEEPDIVKPKIGRRVLALFFASQDEGNHETTMPILVLGGTEINGNDVADGFETAVMSEFADCDSPGPDGSCPMNSVRLVELLDQYRISKQV